MEDNNSIPIENNNNKEEKKDNKKIAEKEKEKDEHNAVSNVSGMYGLDSFK